MCVSNVHGPDDSDHYLLLALLLRVDLNICPTTKMAETFPSLHPPCNAWGDDVYSSLAFQNAGLDVRSLANSALVEYCNNANNWDVLVGMIDAAGQNETVECNFLLLLYWVEWHLTLRVLKLL